MSFEEQDITITSVPQAVAGVSNIALVTPVGRQTVSSSQLAGSSTNVAVKSGPGCHPDFTEADKKSARALEPAFESMLRQAEVCEDVIMAIRLQEITSRQLFVALDRTEEGFCDTCKEAFHVDPSLGFKHKRELGRLVMVWNTAKVQRDTKVQIEAVHKAHGEPISMVTADWVSLLRTFRAKYGNNIHPSRLPVGIHLDSTLTIQTRRRFVSTAPTNTEELRTKYKIMTNMWLLAQMREPGRKLYEDLDKETFMDFADELISEKNFLLEKRINGVKVVIPQWDHCMNYEQELRNEAIRLAMEEGYPIKSALWTAYRNEHHRNEHWIMLIGVTNADLIRGGGTDSKNISQYEQRIQKLEQQLAQARSRSPRRNNSAPVPACLASTTTRTEGHRKEGQGQGEERGKNQSQTQTAISSSAGFRKFNHLMKIGPAKRHLTKQTEVCYKFQSNTCTATPCSRAHRCIGCNKEEVSYDDSGCLESRF